MHFLRIYKKSRSFHQKLINICCISVNILCWGRGRYVTCGVLKQTVKMYRCTYVQMYGAQVSATNPSFTKLALNTDLQGSKTLYISTNLIQLCLWRREKSKEIKLKSQNVINIKIQITTFFRMEVWKNLKL